MRKSKKTSSRTSRLTSDQIKSARDKYIVDKIYEYIKYCDMLENSRRRMINELVMIRRHMDIYFNDNYSTIPIPICDVLVKIRNAANVLGMEEIPIIKSPYERAEVPPEIVLNDFVNHLALLEHNRKRIQDAMSKAHSFLSNNKLLNSGPLNYSTDNLSLFKAAADIKSISFREIAKNIQRPYTWPEDLNPVLNLPNLIPASLNEDPLINELG